MSIKSNLQEITDKLLRMADEICFNNISRNVVYFKRFVKEKQKNESFLASEKSIFFLFQKGNFLNLNELAFEVDKYKKHLVGVDLTLYFSSEEETIILAELVFTKRKFLFWYESSTELNYHCCIKLPTAYNQKEKIDANWHLKDFRANAQNFKVKVYF